MKRLLLLTCVLLVALLSGCCPLAPALWNARAIAGSGKLVTREMDLKGFSRIDAGAAFVLDVTHGDGYAVTVTADDNLIDRLDVSVSGDTLHIRLRPGLSLHSVTMRAKVTLPLLRGLALSGASRATVAGLQSSEDLSLSLSGASSVEGTIAAGDLRLGESGASRAELTGTAGNLRIEGSGASSARLAGLTVKDAHVSLSGASSAEINASGRLDADLSGASRLLYAGDPTLGRMQTSGGSIISAK